MRCPECSTADCYQGFLGYDCVNTLCKHFKNGSVGGVKAVDLRPVSDPDKRPEAGDPVWVDRGGGWSGTADGYLMAGFVVAATPREAVVRLTEDHPSPDGLTTIPKSCEWFACWHHVFPRSV